MKKTIYLIDAMAYAFRAYHAIGATLTDGNNRPTNAVYGFTRILLKLLREHDPEYVAVIFDAPGPNFREEMYPEYKANRAKTPPELIEQFPRMHDVVKAFNLPLLATPGVEADDVIGTLALQAERAGFAVVLVSGDKDLMQLIGSGTRMFDPGKPEEKAWWDEERVRERFGVGPAHVRDALALIGDSADNIPGVRQIGEVKANKLLSQYQSLENLYAHLDEIKGKQREYLEQDREQAFFSRELISIKTDIPLSVTPEDCRREAWDEATVAACFSDLAFHSLLEELGVSKTPPAVEMRYTLVDTRAKLTRLVEDMRTAKRIAVDTETTDIRPMFARLVGVSMCAEPGVAFYIPIGHAPPDLESLMAAPDAPGVEFTASEALESLRPLFEDEGIKKIGHNIKYDMIVLERTGIALKGVALDTMVASYLTDPSRLRHNLDELSSHYLGHKTIPISDLIGKGTKSITFDKVPLDQACAYASEDADVTFRLAQALEPKLREADLDELLNTIETPLVSVLARMEMRGIAIDPAVFDALNQELVNALTTLESTLYELAGESFNINSPKQLQGILYEKLGLEPLRKTKRGYSTDVDTLESLADKHPLPKVMLEYRTLEKLRGTYVEALPRLIHPETGRIHTSFNQAVAATGRLSSSAPNLQNIPARSEYGKRVRRGFVAGRKDACLIAADYSQIELRVLAHLAEDEALCEAFQRGADIHRDTAARMFKVDPEEVTSDMRRQAKAINFGVIYGMSDFSLARHLSISRDAAKRFIEYYFTNYPGIARWLDGVKEQARKDGFVTTLFQRRRYIGDLNSTNAVARSAAERMAINTPVQGSAADIIKLAMVRLDGALEALGANMLLQVHDELVVESAKERSQEVADLMRSVMEGAARLAAPLKVDIGIGANWAEIH